MTLSERDIAAFNLAKSIDYGLKYHLDEYHEFLDTLIYLNESLKESNTQIKYWQKDSETLLLKLCIHGLTIHRICSGLELKSKYYSKEMNGKTIVDISSAKTVLRSKLEAFLMYNNIYVNPKSDEEKELRYNTWIYASLYQRQKYPTNTEMAKRQKESDLKAMEAIKDRIKSLTPFKTLSEKQKNTLLTSGSHKFFNHWATILKESGYSENHTLSISYSHWSSYAHSEGLSAIQLQGESLLYQEHNQMIISDIVTAKMITCKMILQIKQTFKAVEIKYNTLPDSLQHTIELYVELLKKVTL